MATATEGIWDNIEELKVGTDYIGAAAPARKWWTDFEQRHAERPFILLVLLEELTKRGATLTEFWLAITYSFEDTVIANLEYLEETKTKVGKERPLEHTDFIDSSGLPLRLN